MDKETLTGNIFFYGVGAVLLLFTLITGYFRVWWLVYGLLVGTGFYTLFFSPFEMSKKFRKMLWLYYPGGFVILFALTILVRLYFFEIYHIPSDSMSDTLVRGDRVFIEKLSLGPRMPETIFQIPWVGFAAHFIPYYNNRRPDQWWGYRRLRGFTNLKHNDIVVYNTPNEKKQAFIKRAVGLPGDTLEIIGAEIIINGSPIQTPSLVRHIMRIDYYDYTKASALVDSLKLMRYNTNCEQGYISAWVNKSQERSLLGNPHIRSIETETARRDTAFQKFPNDDRYPWTLDDFGPIVIPAKGMKIKLTEENVIFYERVMTHFDGVMTFFKGADLNGNRSGYYLNGKFVEYYEFEQDYYFMMGDLRHDSIDSRYQGFVPETHVIGKARFVLFSRKDSGVNWNRIFFRNFW